MALHLRWDPDTLSDEEKAAWRAAVAHLSVEGTAYVSFRREGPEWLALPPTWGEMYSKGGELGVLTGSPEDTERMRQAIVAALRRAGMPARS